MRSFSHFVHNLEGRAISVVRRSGNAFVLRTVKKQSVQPPKLAEVGQLLPQKKEGRYETGQLFLHKIFSYRGVILFPWTARVYDRDSNNLNNNRVTAAKMQTQQNTSTSTSKITTATATSGKVNTGQSNAENKVASPWHEPDVNNQPMTAATQTVTAANNSDSIIKGKVQTFYQVLIDSRDCPFIRAQTEAVTFLGSQDSNRSLYAIPGLDHVAHDDVLPYSSKEKTPLQHDLFDKFLAYEPDNEPTFVGKEPLKAWKENNHPWLDLSDVHKETTDNIRVTVIPFYMGLRETPVSSVYWWRYCIRLENLGELSVQLRERHWRIFSLAGTLETVRGRGVVGQEPILSPRLPAFQYSSHVSLQSPSGHMWGTFRMERADGYSFDCKIPPFSLESKYLDKRPPPTTTPTPSRRTPKTTSIPTPKNTSKTTSPDFIKDKPPQGNQTAFNAHLAARKFNKTIKCRGLQIHRFRKILRPLQAAVNKLNTTKARRCKTLSRCSLLDTFKNSKKGGGWGGSNGGH